MVIQLYRHYRMNFHTVYIIFLGQIQDFGLIQFKKEIRNFAANIEICFTFRINEFTTSGNQIPCVLPVFWQNG